MATVNTTSFFNITVLANASAKIIHHAIRTGIKHSLIAVA
jgi:hypothetical protein